MPHFTLETSPLAGLWEVQRTSDRKRIARGTLAQMQAFLDTQNLAHPQPVVTQTIDEEVKVTFVG